MIKVYSHSDNSDLRQYAALEAKGYRRTSNRHGLISRIDRPDWLDALNRHLMRSAQQGNLILENSEEYNSGSWQDFYRRVLSKDTLEIGKSQAQNIGTSSWDNIGYIEILTKELA